MNDFTPVVGEIYETSYDFSDDQSRPESGFNIIKVVYIHKDIVVGEDSEGKAWGYITSIYKFRPEVKSEAK